MGSRPASKVLKSIAALVLAALLLLSGSVAYAKETRVDLASGAEPGPGYVSVNQSFDTPDGAYTLVMSGLKRENRDAAISALEMYYDPAATEGLVLVDDAFPDAEKYNSDASITSMESDSRKCWAGSVSNMLWVSGWAERLENPLTGAPFTSEDDVFEYYSGKFSNGGSGTPAAIDWFFMGEFFEIAYSPGHASLYKRNNPEDGLMKSFVSTFVQSSYDIASEPELVSALERLDLSSSDPAVFHGAIGPVNWSIRAESSAHAVNVVGAIVDETAKEPSERYKALVIVDSDNDGTPLCGTMDPADLSAEERFQDKVARPNTVTVYNLKWTYDSAGDPCWEIVGYEDAQEWYLYTLNALPWYDEALPSTYQEQEGTRDVASQVDLALGEAFTTDRETAIIDLYHVDLDDVTVSEFEQGRPIKVNYFVQNRSGLVLDQQFLGDADLSVDWQVTRDSDGEVVASGQSVCTVPIYFGIQLGNLLILNGEGDEAARWEPGSYTVSLDLNADRAVPESYYLNNQTKEVSFTVVASEEPPEPEEPDVPEDPEEPEEPEKPEEPGEVEPEQPDVEPEQPDVEPEQPDVEPDQPDVEPEQPEERPDEQEPSEDPKHVPEPQRMTPTPQSAPRTSEASRTTIPETADSTHPYAVAVLALVGVLATLAGCVTRLLFRYE